MLRFLQKKHLHFRAFFAAFLFFSVWLASPLRMMLPEPPSCGKACCLEAGACCCYIRSVFWHGHAYGPHDHSGDEAAQGEIQLPAQLRRTFVSKVN